MTFFDLGLVLDCHLSLRRKAYYLRFTQLNLDLQFLVLFYFTSAKDSFKLPQLSDES